MTPEAHKHLSSRDPVMRLLIREHGLCELVPETRRQPFQSLVQAVAHQQLNGTAANTILGRFRKLFPSRKFPRPEDLAGVTDQEIRACGFSFAKIKAIRDIAEKTLSGVIPSSREIVKLSDDEIITRLTQVRGVGQWTVEMFCPCTILGCAPASAMPTRSGVCQRRNKSWRLARSGVRIAPRLHGSSGARPMP
jgi:DNA-3-methyladenine glycosylase II